MQNDCAENPIPTGFDAVFYNITAELQDLLMTFSSVPHFQVKNLLKRFGGLPFTDLVMGSRADTISEQLSQEQEVIEVQSNLPVQHCFHKTSHGRAACHQKT